MPCYHPLKAFQCFDKSIVFDEVRKHDIVRSLDLPCGQCVGCRLERSRQWAIRCMHEAQLHKHNCFITLTYDNTHLDPNKSLDYEDFKGFIKRFRRHVEYHYGSSTKIRFYMAGEYGENFGRPHFHACIFGYDFPDKKLWKRTPAGSLIYRSTELEALWPFGYSSVGDLNFESAAYTARYIMKKVTGKHQNQHYHELDPETGEIIKRTPEFNKMSLKPGIGCDFYKKYTSDIYPQDYIILRGKKVKPPKYYDKQYKIDQPYEYDELLYMREKNAKLNSEDNTPERLNAKETVTLAKLQKLKRNLT
ncbi:MAG: replication initiator protein [Microvirus sp.]|nr:MAG: replication initiator protein [Microvirus sp.]